MMHDFIEYDEMPDDTLGLNKIEIDFPRLVPDTEISAPVKRHDILRELHLQESAPFAIQVEDLQFIRTARIRGKCYWLWQFERSGKTYYVSVGLLNNGDVSFSYEENYGEWTPEQYLLGDYHDFFYDHWRQLYTVRYSPDHPAMVNLKNN